MGAIARNRSCPAVSQIWILHASPCAVTIFFVRKNAPIVLCCLRARGAGSLGARGAAAARARDAPRVVQALDEAQHEAGLADAAVACAARVLAGGPRGRRRGRRTQQHDLKLVVLLRQLGHRGRGSPGGEAGDPTRRLGPEGARGGRPRPGCGRCLCLQTTPVAMVDVS
jgi:hypothetical protein